MVKNNRKDGLSTYPSKSRLEYAYFTSTHIFKRDFGYLAYNKNKQGIEGIKQVRSYADLKKFTFIGLSGVGWEIDNIPAFIPRELAPNMKVAFNLLLRRMAGDFMVVSPEHASYLAPLYGFDSKQLGFVRADYITNKDVPYHVGLRKQFPNAKKIIGEIDAVLRSARFKEKSKQIFNNY